MQHVGILGGTFNPPHIGHLMMADQVMSQLGLDKIIFLPDANPPHVDHKEAVPVLHRVEMVRRAIINHTNFDLGLMEVERGGISYTYDTVQQLVTEHPENKYYFIIGGDMVAYLPKWHRIDELVQLVQFVGVKRPNISQTSPYPIIWVNMPEVDISSTWIRKTLQNNGSVRYYVPDLVLQYIAEKRLYFNDRKK
ncbi:nicotinate-nucleotide adenylyltransferase [Bombilactobacillus thymidiniphilus]|uniref:Probable nicotinate-nucleotide adenylyltransferase n=1 Tax=Bombilactobacillus thymidiniphilus TaxID=2923363 RepID=A0ABY4PGB3_9LACO|nr:nicotinate-nucleotide adenylyltransferase [Bombilactobacillus thymidiniphilus]UQS84372.1 nicotinate-nucleotide adenylyltransferase [Bombilactobacillus thymidiniphilus]